MDEECPMNNEMLEKLMCLHCRASSFKAKKDYLVCSACGENISLEAHIPNFITPDELEQSHFTWVDPHAYEERIASITQRLARIDTPILGYVNGDTLEVGSGTCRLMQPVEECGGVYFGIDHSLPLLTYAYTQRNASRIVCGKGEHMPFRNDSFDTIISSYLAFREVDPARGLPEARRVLKKGGICVFHTLNHWIHLLIDFKKLLFSGNVRGLKTFQWKPSSDHFEFVRSSVIKRMAHKAGFRVERILSAPIMPVFSRFDNYLHTVYFQGKKTIYFGYEVIVALKAV